MIANAENWRGAQLRPAKIEIRIDIDAISFAFNDLGNFQPPQIHKI